MGEDNFLPYYFYGGDKVTFQELINLTKVYTRDTDSRIFTDADIKMFITRHRRIRQITFESGIFQLVIRYLPYHYILCIKIV